MKKFKLRHSKLPKQTKLRTLKMQVSQTAGQNTCHEDLASVVTDVQRTDLRFSTILFFFNFGSIPRAIL
jgi:hypothetical protein